MVNGPPCAVCGFTLRWLPQQNGWGCDRCQRMFPAAPQQAAPPPQLYQQQGFGRPQPAPQQPPQPQYPQQHAGGYQNQYAQPHGQQPHPQQGYGQQQPYSPHPAQPVPPVARSGGKQGGKGLLIGGAIAVVAIAGGAVAFVMLRGGGGTSGGDGRSAVVKSTLAALGDGDVDQLMRLSDIPGVYDRVVDCSGKTPPRDKDADDGEETAEQRENRDPKKQVEKRKQEFAETLVPLTKGAKIELVEIVSKEPAAPKDKPKGADKPEQDEEALGMVLPIGTRMHAGCYAKVPFRFHTAKLKVKVTPKGEAAIEQEAEMTMLQVGTGFWLAEPPHLNLGTAALERELTAMKDKVCACPKAECAQKIKDEFKESPRRKEIKKQIRALSEADQAKFETIEDGMKACEQKLEGGAQLAAMEQFKDKMCNCTDRACVDKVTQEMTVYGKSHVDAKVSDDDMKNLTIVNEQMGKCIAKVDEAERARNPPPDPGGGIGATIAESTEATDTSGVPPACAAYEKVLDELLQCPAFPKSQHQSIEDSRKALQLGYKDYKRLPKDAQKSINDTCSQGIDAMRQALKAMNC